MNGSGRKLAIPSFLGLSWWWLFLAIVAEVTCVAHFNWRFYGYLPASMTFAYLWVYVQAIWLKRAEPESKAIYWYIACDIVRIGYAIALAYGLAPSSWEEGLIGVLSFALGFYSIFKFKWEMEYHFTKTDPVGLELSGLMTFFFSIFYFQYHFHQIYRYKQHDPLTITPAAA